MTDQTTLNTEYGEIILETRYYRSDIEFSSGKFGVELLCPKQDAESKALAEGSSAHFGYATIKPGEEQKAFGNLLDFVCGVAAMIDEANADRIEAAQEAEAKAKAERDRQKAEHEAVLEERKERLLTEFMGEQGRARMRGYKTSVPVEVKASKAGYGDDAEEYIPRIFSKNYADQTRTTDYKQCRRFEVKVSGRYMLVWDDGPDDLSQWERESYSAKRNVPKYDGQLTPDGGGVAAGR